MPESIAREVVASGTDTEKVARTVVDALAANDLRVAFVFADHRHDPYVIARVTQRGLAPAPVIGGSTTDVIARGVTKDARSVAALGLYGDWVHPGVGVAPDLPKSALGRSRDAVHQAALAIGRSPSGLDPSRHVGVSIVDGKCDHAEAFCIGSAAAAPQIRVVGGCSATDVESPGHPHMWVHGEVLTDAGLVVLLESELPFYALTSVHLMPTEIKMVVTGASGLRITELDGRPAGPHLREVIDGLGGTIDPERPSGYSFARYVDGVPYVRSITKVDGDDVQTATVVEVGHVLRLMGPGDLIGTTARDLLAAADRVGGTMAAFLAFSCLGRHWEAAARGLEVELADTYARYPTIGFQSFGEQSGMLLVNHSLTGLAIGARRP